MPPVISLLYFPCGVLTKKGCAVVSVLQVGSDTWRHGLAQPQSDVSLRSEQGIAPAFPTS